MEQICINDLCEKYDDFLTYFINFMNENDVYIYENKESIEPIGTLTLIEFDEKNRKYNFEWNYEKKYNTIKNENFYGVRFNNGVRLYITFENKSICYCIL